MGNRAISDPELFFASLQAQYDIFINQENARGSQTHQFDKRQQKLDHELDELIDNLNFHPDFSMPKPPLALREKEDGVRAKIHTPSKRHLAPAVQQTTSRLPTRSSSHFNILATAFSGATVMILALSWFNWPTSQWNWPYVPPQIVLADTTEPVASASVVDTAVPVASANIVDTAPNKSNALNTILAVNPAGAGHETEPARQKSAVDNLLKIVPPVGIIRSEPGLQGDRISGLARGSLVVKLGRQGDWFRVRLPNNREGWAYKTIVTPAMNAENTDPQASKISHHSN